MPRNIDPSNITTGTGLAADDSIESNALVSPTGGNDGLRVHINDPSRAHMAEAIGVEDTAENFVSDEVEGALAELAGAGAAGRVNGLVSGGTSTASSGLTYELDSGTSVLLNGTLHDYSGQQVTLPSTGTHYVYIDASSGNLTFSTGSPPLLTTEPILIEEVTTAAGVISNKTDLRFFVFNLDRKNALIVRSAGADFNQRSEANFITMEAALRYLDLYAGSGTEEAETHHIIVRGEHRFPSGMTLSVEGTILEGDGTGVLVTDGTATLLTVAGNNCTVRNLRFVADANPSTGIWLTASGCAVENCSVEAGTQQWSEGIRVSADISHITNTFIEAEDTGLEFPSGTVLTQGQYENLVIQGNRAAGSLGIDLFGDVGNPSRDFQFNNVRVSSFETGLDSVYMNDYTLTDCVFEDVDFGLDFLTGERIHMNNCRVSISSASTTTSSISAILFDVDYGTLTDCHIESLRTTYTGTFPTMVGVEMEGIQNKITNTRVTGFLNTNTNAGTGIRLERSESAAIGCTVVGGSTGIRLQSGATDAVISGCVVLDNSDIGISLSSDADRATVTDCRVVLNDSGRIGVSNISDDGKILNCHFESTRTTYSGGEFIVGIYDQGGDTVISGCTVRNFLNTADNSGRGIYLSGILANRKVRDCTIVDAQVGIDVGSSIPSGVQISGCTISGVETGIQVPTAERGFIQDCEITCDSSRGLTGIATGSNAGSNFTIGNCNLLLNRGVWTGVVDTPIGIDGGSGTSNLTIDNCTITGFYNPDATVGRGVSFETLRGIVTNCRIVDTHIGAFIRFAPGGAGEGMILDSSLIEDCFAGIDVDGTNGGSSTNLSIGNTVINLSPTRGLTGIQLTAVSNSSISTCKINNPRSAGSYGVSDEPAGISTGNSTFLQMEDCIISGFANTASSPDQGAGILAGAGLFLNVEDCTISSSTRGIDGTSLIGALTVSGGYFFGVGDGIVATTTDRANIQGLAIELDSATGLQGILLGNAGGTGGGGGDSIITGCTITQGRSSWVGVTDVPYGIYVQDDTVQISDNRIEGFYNSNIADGYGIRTSDENMLVTGNIITGCHKGVAVEPVDNNVYTNFIVSDNVVNGGNGVGSIGIGILGFEDGIIRRVSITGNTIRRINDQGIYVLGEVLRGSISNNQIDANTTLDFQNPTATGILLDSISAFNASPRDLTLSGNEISRGVAGIVCKGIQESEPIHSLSITGNVISYCGIAWDGAGNGEENADNISRGIHVLWGKQVTITGNTLHDIGAVNDNGSLPSGASTTLPNGIRIELSTQVSVTGNTLEDFKAQGNLGLGTGIFIAEWNATVTTHENEDTLIANNTLRSVGDYGIRIDVQEGSITPRQHILRNLKVMGNIIRNVEINAILVRSGDETVPANGSTIENLTIENNQSFNLTGTADIPSMTVTLTGVLAGDTFSINHLQVGPSVTFEATSGTPPLGGAQFNISGTDSTDAANLAAAINLDSNWGERHIRPVYAEASGNVVTVYLLKEGQIGGNQWSLSSSNGTRLSLSTSILSSGIGNSLDGPAHIHVDAREDGDMERIKITGNYLQGSAEPGVTGIRLRSRGNSAASTVRNYVIADNQVDGENRGNSTGISFQTLNNASGFANTDVRNNELRNLTRGGIQVWTELNVELQDFAVRGNRFEDCSWCGLVLQFNEQVSNLTVTDNEFFASDRVSTNDYQGAYLNFGILGTTFSGAAALSGGRINDNTFIKMDRFGFRLTSFRDEADGVSPDNTMADFREITFNGNSFREVATTDSLMLPAFFLLSGDGLNLSFNNNHFYSCGSDGFTANLILEAIGFGKTYDNIDMCGNSVRNSPGGGVRIDFLDQVDGNDPDAVQNVVMNDNRIQNCGDSGDSTLGVSLSLGDGTTHNGVTMSNNIIDGSLGSNRLERGVYVGGAQAASLVALSVCGNTVRDVADYGITIQGSETDGLSNRSFRISGNTVSQALVGGIELVAVASGTGSPLFINGSRMGLRNCIISDNIVGGTGTSGGGHGIRVQWEPDLDEAAPVAGDGIQNLTIANNIVRQHGLNAGYTFVSSQPGGDHGFSIRAPCANQSWSITGNQARENAGYGFFFDLGIDAQPERSGSISRKYHAGSIVAPIVITSNISENNDQGTASGAGNSGGGSNELQVGAYGTGWDADNNFDGTPGLAGNIPNNGVCALNTSNITAGGTPNNRTWEDITDSNWLGSSSPSATTDPFNEVG